MVMKRQDDGGNVGRGGGGGTMVVLEVRCKIDSLWLEYQPGRHTLPRQRPRTPTVIPMLLCTTLLPLPAPRLHFPPPCTPSDLACV